MRIYGSGSKGQYIKSKTEKKNFFISKPKSELLKKDILKISRFLNGSSFSIKNEKFENFALLNKFSKSYRNDPGPFFPVRIPIKIKWTLSTAGMLNKVTPLLKNSCIVYTH